MVAYGSDMSVLSQFYEMVQTIIKVQYAAVSEGKSNPDVKSLKGLLEFHDELEARLDRELKEATAKEKVEMLVKRFLPTLSLSELELFYAGIQEALRRAHGAVNKTVSADRQ